MGIAREAQARCAAAPALELVVVDDVDGRSELVKHPRRLLSASCNVDINLVLPRRRLQLGPDTLTLGRLVDLESAGLHGPVCGGQRFHSSKASYILRVLVRNLLRVLGFELTIRK